MARMQKTGAGLLLGALAVAAVASCDKHVSPVESLPVTQATSLDANAGGWRMFVLAGPDQVVVPAPDAAGSAAYAAQLDSVRRAQAGATDADRQAVAYWGAGGVLRWNEIQRELTARFNLPPAPNADGTYTIPSAANPFGYPQFPFSNPPYAARAYSYVAVAQYEALKAAWHYKFRYNRAAPGVVDPAVGDAGVALGAVRPTALPAYPSEAATLAGASSEVLKLLFPAAADEIAARAAEAQRAAVVSGAATPSDLAAGVALGKAVAALVIARAKADGMGQAVGTPALWQALADSARMRGEIPWLSQDSPARPPMLPAFGKVKAWTMSSAGVDSLLPPAPPSTGSAGMAADLAEVKQTVTNLTRDQLAVAQKWNDGAGTYTPPGHWNQIAAGYVSGARMSEVRAARTFALLNMAMHDAAVGCWRVKYRYFNPRPAQLDPSIKTVIGLPNFPSYPSGHSTFSAAAAGVLGHLFPSAAAAFDQQADEAGISRMYGGIHYRTDVTGGKLHGRRVGAAVVRVAQGDGAE